MSILRALAICFLLVLIVVSFYAADRRTEEERKRTLIMRDMQTKINKLWENLK